MKKILVLLLCLEMVGCASFLATTATSGTSFGMSREAVMRVIEKKEYKIISNDENTVVVEGMQEQMKAPAIKTFTFQKNRLISVSDKVLDGRLKGTTLIFQK
jgi:hypothetical protein